MIPFPRFGYRLRSRTKRNVSKILAKFGVPNKLIRLLKVLRATFVAKFTVDDVTQSLDCIIGDM